MNPGRERGSLVLAVGFLLLALMVMTIPFTTYVVDLAMALVLLAVPVSYGVIRTKIGKFDYFEFIYPASILFFMYFGFSALYLKQNVMALQYRSLVYWLTPALALALVGYIAMIAGYLSLGRRIRRSRFGALVPTKMLSYFFIGGIGFIGQVANYIRERTFVSGGKLSGLISIGQQVSLIYFFAWFLVWYMYWSGKLSTTRRNLLFSAFIPASMLVVYMHVGSKELAIVTVGIPVVSYWYARRIMPWKSLAAILLVAVFIIFPLYNTYRIQDDRMDTASRLEQSVNVATRGGKTNLLAQSLEMFFKRMGIITSVAAVLKDVPDHVDYRYGDTLLLAPIGLFIPRILWPDKPIIGIGHEFGTTFHLVSYVDRTTKIAPSLIGEFYWNFGIPAVVIGMFLVGACYRYVYEKFGAAQGFDPICKGIYVLLFLRLIHIEGSFGGTVGLVVKSYIAIHVLLVVSKKLGLLGEMVAIDDREEPA